MFFGSLFLTPLFSIKSMSSRERCSSVGIRWSPVTIRQRYSLPITKRVERQHLIFRAKQIQLLYHTILDFTRLNLTFHVYNDSIVNGSIISKKISILISMVTCWSCDGHVIKCNFLYSIDSIKIYNRASIKTESNTKYCLVLHYTRLSWVLYFAEWSNPELVLNIW